MLHLKEAGMENRKLDEESFEKLFKTYFSSLTLFAMKYVPDLDAAKDIVHGVFLNLWERRNQTKADASLKSYLFTSVYNRSLNYVRDHKKFRQGLLSDVDLESSEDDVTAGIEAGELESRITLALDLLPEKCRQVFTLNRFEGLKYKEIAAKLNISLKTVEAQMSKALRVLRTELVDYLPIWIVMFYLFNKL